MNRHFPEDFLILCITLPLCLFFSNDLESKFVQFADACTPQWSNLLYFLHGLIVGFLFALLPLATRSLASIAIVLLMRFFPDNEQPEEVEP